MILRNKTKPNETCPCLSGKKYKKCCKKKGLFTKKADDLPSLWKNLGESHPLLRFVVGDRVECRIGELETKNEDDNDVGEFLRGIAIDPCVVVSLLCALCGEVVFLDIVSFSL